MSTDECRKRIGSVRSAPAVLCGVLAVFTAMSLVGCRSVREADALQDSPDEGFTDATVLVSALQQYVDTTGALPGSRKVLQDFCSTEGLPCATLDWSKFSWETATDDSITVWYEGNGYSLPITMTMDSASQSEPGQVESELKERLRELMEQ